MQIMLMKQNSSQHGKSHEKHVCKTKKPRMTKKATIGKKRAIKKLPQNPLVQD